MHDLNKRGNVLEEPLMMIFWLFIAVGVYFISMQVVNKTLDPLDFEKEFLAKDVSLLIDSMYAVPGNVRVFYPATPFDTTINIQPDKVTVYEYELDPLKKTYPFSIHPNIVLTAAALSSEENNTFTKTSSFALQPADAAEKLPHFICPPAPTKDNLWKDKEIAVHENDAANLAEVLTRAFNLKPLIETQAPDMVIGVGRAPGSIIKIHHTGNPQTQKLACIIGNELKKAFPHHDIILLPESYDELQKEESDILEAYTIAVHIELPDQQIPAPETALAINNALQKYHE